MARKPSEKRKLKAINKWAEYEAEKRKIQNLALTPREYQNLIDKLIKRLGI